MKLDTTNATEELCGSNSGAVVEPEHLPPGDLMGLIHECGLVAATMSVRRFVELSAARLKEDRHRLL